MTSASCQVGQARYGGIPVFYSGDGIVVPLTRYMIQLRYVEGKPRGSVETYAYHLQRFFKWLACQNPIVAWNSVTDVHLISYRDSGFRRGTSESRGNESTIERSLSVIFGFYVWAELAHLLDGHVACYVDRRERVFKISAVLRNGKRPRWEWPHARALKGRKAHRPTPTDSEIETLHAYIYASSECPDRDAAIAKLFEECAFRTEETLSIAKEMVPSWNEIETALTEDRAFDLEVMGKGGRKRSSPVLPETMQFLREYIEGERAQVVAALKKRDPTYKDSKSLFLSAKTGKALTRTGLSHRMIKLMRGAGMKGVSGHRIRARSLTNIVDAEDQPGPSGQYPPVEQSLMRAQSRAGHLSKEALEPYLNDARKEKFTTGDETLAAHSKLRNLQIKARRVEAVLNESSDSAELMELIKAGRKGAARKLLEKLLSKSSQH